MESTIRTIFNDDNDLVSKLNRSLKYMIEEGYFDLECLEISHYYRKCNNCHWVDGDIDCNCICECKDPNTRTIDPLTKRPICTCGYICDCCCECDLSQIINCKNEDYDYDSFIDFAKKVNEKKRLIIGCCSMEIPNLANLKNLSELEIRSCEIKNPDISMLSKLKVARIIIYYNQGSIY
mgnify:CR=1 FL=1